MTRRLVYLDQSAWSAVDAEPGSDFTQQLAAWGRSGLASYLVSWEVLIETAALGPGRQKRWEALRALPGSVLAPELTVEAMLQRDGQALAAHAAGSPMPPAWEVHAQPLSFTSTAELEAQVKRLMRLRGHLFASAHATRVGRKADRGKTKEQRRRQEVRTAALLRGDAAEFIRLSERPMNAGHRAVARMLARVASAAAAWAYARGYLAPYHKRLDPIFFTCVMPFLPTAVRQDGKLLRRVAAAWNRGEAPGVAPSLACEAAVATRAHYARVRDDEDDYPGSENVDRRHVVYAPIVDVFTCDTRNADPIRRVLASAGRPTGVAVAGRPAEVLTVVQDAIDGRSP